MNNRYSSINDNKEKEIHSEKRKISLKKKEILKEEFIFYFIIIIILIIYMTN